MTNPRPKRRLDFKTQLGIVVSVVCLFLVMRKVEWAQFYQTLLRIAWWPFLMALVFQGLQLTTRGYRWTVLLGAFKPVRYWRILQVWIVGLMLNNTLPGKIGEVSKAFLIRRQEAIPITTVFSTIVLERFLDVLVVAATLAYVLLIGIFPLQLGEYDLSSTSIALGLAAFGGAGGLALLALYQDIVLRHVHRGLRWVNQSLADRVIGILTSLLSGLNPKSYEGRVGKAAGLSALGWVFIVVSTWYCFQAVGIDPGWNVAILFIVTTTFCMLIPNTPGYIGTFHFIATETLALHGVSYADGLAVAILTHASWYFPETIGGVWFLWRLGMSVDELRDVEHQAGDEGVSEATPANPPAP